jgi:hypothetical protein
MDDGMCYEREWFSKKVETDFQLLCPLCQKLFSENNMCEDCGCFIEEQEFIVNDLYNYNARQQRAYHRLDHFKDVLGQFQGREGKNIPLEILSHIKNELSACNEVTAVDVKKVMRKLKLTKNKLKLLFYPLHRHRSTATLHQAGDRRQHREDA